MSQEPFPSQAKTVAVRGHEVSYKIYLPKKDCGNRADSPVESATSINAEMPGMTLTAEPLTHHELEKVQFRAVPKRTQRIEIAEPWEFRVLDMFAIDGSAALPRMHHQSARHES